MEPFLKAVEVGLGVGGTRGAFVTLRAHARDLEVEEPAADHRVFDHVKHSSASLYVCSVDCWATPPAPTLTNPVS